MGCRKAPPVQRAQTWSSGLGLQASLACTTGTNPGAQGWRVGCTCTAGTQWGLTLRCCGHTMALRPLAGPKSGALGPLYGRAGRGWGLGSLAAALGLQQGPWAHGWGLGPMAGALGPWLGPGAEAPMLEQPHEGAASARSSEKLLLWAAAACVRGVRPRRASAAAHGAHQTPPVALVQLMGCCAVWAGHTGQWYNNDIPLTPAVPRHAEPHPGCCCHGQHEAV